MQSLKKFLRENFLLLVILGLAIFLRLSIFDYPLIQEETNRDFLVTRHIAKYGELISFGPRNGTLPGFGNSPAYYYFLAGLFLLFDNIMFVSTVNFALQIITIVLIYLIVKEIFDRETALISALFLAVARIFILASRWVWQPHIMYFFLVLSSYFLFLFYQKRKTIFLTISIVLFTFSSALHMSTFGLFPAFLVAVFLILGRLGTSLRTKIIMFLLFGFSTVLFFAPPALKAIFDFENLVSLSGGTFVVSPGELFSNLWERTNLLFSSFNPAFLAVVLILSVVYLFSTKVNKNPKRLYFILIGAIFSFLLIFSFLNERFFDQHFYPLYPILVVLGAEGLNRIFPLKLPFVLIKYAFVAFLAIILVNGVSEMSIGSAPFERLQAANEISESLSSEVQKIKDQENKENLNFFQFRVYSPPERAWFAQNENIIDSIYWLLLEKRLNTPFTVVHEDANIIRSSYQVINSDEYIFINCLNYDNEEDEKNDCLTRFKAENNKHEVLTKLPEKIYGHSFYVARR